MAMAMGNNKYGSSEMCTTEQQWQQQPAINTENLENIT